MLRTTLLAAAAMVALGATAAHAGGGHGHKGYDRGGYGGYEQRHAPGPYAGHYRHHNKHRGAKRAYRYGPNWFDYRGRPYCRFEPRKVPVKVWDRRGNSYRKWVWKDVRVCA